MKPLIHRTKIVATIGPASDSPTMIQNMMLAGMNVARLNFSHGNYEQHASRIKVLRDISAQLSLPLLILQDLQGPKIRVGNLSPEGLHLQTGDPLALVPLSKFNHQAHTIGIDYRDLAKEAEPGIEILLDDGLLKLSVEKVEMETVHCRVLEGGTLTSHKGVNVPALNLRLPSITEKDKQDLNFGIEQEVDMVSLSFVRQPEDIKALKTLLQDKKVEVPVLAKLEKPQAIANLEAMVDECDAIMVARGDLGVEMSPEKVPLIQKQIIKLCNRKGIPVITATQMLDSMIDNPRPTRAEASDVANAIIDGTDAVMLSGESAVGKYPLESVQMLAKIATEVEPSIQFVNYPPQTNTDTEAICEALNIIDKTLDLQCIVAFTETGNTALLVSQERPKAPIVAYTPYPKVYRQLSLSWGVRPVLLQETHDDVIDVINRMEIDLIQRQFAKPGDKVLIIGGIPFEQTGGTNFLKIHTIDSK